MGGVESNTTRLMSGSFKVNLTTGKWGDFAKDDKGSDLISLYAYLNSLKNGKAAQKLAEQLGLNNQNNKKSYSYTPRSTLQHCNTPAHSINMLPLKNCQLSFCESWAWRI